MMKVAKKDLNHRRRSFAFTNNDFIEGTILLEAVRQVILADSDLEESENESFVTSCVEEVKRLSVVDVQLILDSTRPLLQSKISILGSILSRALVKLSFCFDLIRVMDARLRSTSPALRLSSKNGSLPAHATTWRLNLGLILKKLVASFDDMNL